MSRRDLARDAAILACAVSAGIHGALTPDHFAETTGAGVGFALATVALAAAALTVTVRPAGVLVPAATAALLVGLLAAYALAVTSGVPVLHPEPEAVDGLAVVTKAVEAVGLLAACALVRPPGLSALIHPKGT